MSFAASGSNWAAFMLISLRSPLGGRPLRMWMRTQKKGEPNIDLLEKSEQPRITEESLYCVKIGYLDDGSEALIKDTEAHHLYTLLKKYYA